MTIHSCWLWRALVAVSGGRDGRSGNYSSGTRRVTARPIQLGVLSTASNCVSSFSCSSGLAHVCAGARLDIHRLRLMAFLGNLAPAASATTMHRGPFTDRFCYIRYRTYRCLLRKSRREHCGVWPNDRKLNPARCRVRFGGGRTRLVHEQRNQNNDGDGNAEKEQK